MKSALLIFPVLFCCLLLSCKQQNNESPDYGQGVGQCRISIFTDYLNNQKAGSSQIHYDASGRLTSVDYPGSKDNFVFHGDTIFVNSSSCGGRTDTIILENSRIKIAAYGDQRAHRVVRYFYDANGLLQMSRSNVYGVIQEDYFIWSNGDLIADSTVADGTLEGVSRYEYDSNHPDQIGNPGTIMFYLTNGLPLYRTRHLLTRISNTEGPGYKYSYIFDGNQKISRAFIVGSEHSNDTSAFEYTYDCH